MWGDSFPFYTENHIKKIYDENPQCSLFSGHTWSQFDSGNAAVSLIVAVAPEMSLASATLWYLLALGTNETRSK